MNRLRTGLFIAVLAFLLAGCTAASQQRGLAGNAYVSSSRPALVAEAPGLTVKTAGRGTGTLYEPSMTGSVTLTVRTVVYATTPDAPMAVIVHADLGSRQYYWTTVHPRIGAVHTGSEIISGTACEAYTYLVPVRSDPFGGLAGEEPAEGQQAYWLARYFAYKTNFNSDKIILEYREPAPEELASLADADALFLAAFEERARKAFILSVPEGDVEGVQDGFPTGVRWQYMSDLFLGDVFELDPLKRLF